MSERKFLSLFELATDTDEKKLHGARLLVSFSQYLWLAARAFQGLGAETRR